MHITEPFTPALLQNERNKFASISMLRMPCWNYRYPSENGCWSRWGQCGRCSHNSWHFWLWTMVHGLWSTFTWTSLRSKDFGQVKHLKEVFTCRHMLHMICIPLSFNPLTFFQIFMTRCLIEVLVQFQIVQICKYFGRVWQWNLTKIANSSSLKVNKKCNSIRWSWISERKSVDQNCNGMYLICNLCCRMIASINCFTGPKS